MENIIYNELICRGCSVDVGVVEVVESKEGKRTKKQCEIDFVVNTFYLLHHIALPHETKMMWSNIPNILRLCL